MIRTPIAIAIGNPYIRPLALRLGLGLVLDPEPTPWRRRIPGVLFPVDGPPIG